jgi:hypothetical protein
MAGQLQLEVSRVRRSHREAMRRRRLRQVLAVGRRASLRTFFTKWRIVSMKLAPPHCLDVLRRIFRKQEIKKQSCALALQRWRALAYGIALSGATCYVKENVELQYAISLLGQRIKKEVAARQDAEARAAAAQSELSSLKFKMQDVHEKLAVATSEVELLRHLLVESVEEGITRDRIHLNSHGPASATFDDESRAAVSPPRVMENHTPTQRPRSPPKQSANFCSPVSSESLAAGSLVVGSSPTGDLSDQQFANSEQLNQFQQGLPAQATFDAYKGSIMESFRACAGNFAGWGTGMMMDRAGFIRFSRNVKLVPQITDIRSVVEIFDNYIKKRPEIDLDEIGELLLQIADGVFSDNAAWTARERLHTLLHALDLHRGKKKIRCPPVYAGIAIEGQLWRAFMFAGRRGSSSSWMTSSSFLRFCCNCGLDKVLSKPKIDIVYRKAIQRTFSNDLQRMSFPCFIAALAEIGTQVIRAGGRGAQQSDIEDMCGNSLNVICSMIPIKNRR